MEKSRYNIIIQLTPRYTLVYNSLNNRYLMLSEHLKNVLDKDETYIKEKHSLFYQQLLKIGYYVNSGINEVDIIKDRIQKVDNDNKAFRLIINPTLNCNFRCWYCYEDHDFKSIMSGETVKCIKAFISKITMSNTLSKFNLSFFGGEPLLHFKDVVLPIAEYCKHVCETCGIELYVGITTNGYLINEQIIENFKKIGLKSAQITLDGCKEDHDKVRKSATGKGSYDKIFTNIRNLAENHINVTLRINYTAANIEKVFSIKDNLQTIPQESRKYIHINFQRVWQDRGTNKVQENTISRYIDDLGIKFNEMNFLASPTLPNYVWGSCYADKKNEIVINYNGDLYKCTARDFNASNRIGYLSDKGSLIFDKAKIKNWENIRFTREYCHQCKIAPLCGGGCTQRHIEYLGNDGCTYGYDEADKEKVILDHFYNTIINNEISHTIPT